MRDRSETMSVAVMMLRVVVSLIVTLAYAMCCRSAVTQRFCWRAATVTSMWRGGLLRRLAAMRDRRKMRCAIYDREAPAFRLPWWRRRCVRFSLVRCAAGRTDGSCSRVHERALERCAVADRRARCGLGRSKCAVRCVSVSAAHWWVIVTATSERPVSAACTRRAA